MAASALPATLRGVTSTKIAELKKQRKDFQDAKAAIEANVSKCRKAGDRIGETKALIDGVCQLEGVYLKDLESEDDQDLTLHPSDGLSAAKLYTYSRLLKQSAIDPALPKSIIDDIQRDLLKDLNLKTIQHQHAELYGLLVTEYVSDNGADPAQFESVGREEMHEQRKTWEELVFGTTEVDGDNIQSYLTNLFTSKSQVKRAHDVLRKRLRSFSVRLASEEIFDVDSLKIYIKGLLATDLLSEEKKAILKTFTSNKAVLQEVADVLTMRFKSLGTWQYTTENGAIPVEQRRQLNGKYRFYLDQDVLDAILIHAVGMKWAVEFRAALKQFQSSHAWSRHQTEIPLKDRQRREWFLGSASALNSVASRRASDYDKDYFMTLLPDTVEEGPRSYDDDADSDNMDFQNASSRKNPLETKHGLLHLLVTEAIIARHINPNVEHTVIRSDFKWFGPSLPHNSIFKTLEFFGVEDPWLSFFRKFLATPLRFAQDGPEGQVRTRQRGIPMSMVLADVLGEVVLFVMDFAVNTSTKGFLYRLHDDFWYWNDKSSCRTAWQQMRHFANVMGMSFNEEKTGSVVFPPAADPETSDDESVDSEPVAVAGLPTGDVRWGFLKLDTKSCRFVIDQKEVDKHIQELKVQLKAHSTSVFDYIQAYNGYAVRFFTNNFGKPSFGFGRVHVDDMMTTLTRVHNELYPQGRVADELTAMVEKRFGVKASDLSDGFWFWPVANGGMEIRNPFVPLVNMRELFRRTPERILEKAMENEDADYVSAKQRYDRKNNGWGMNSTNTSLRTALDLRGDAPFWSKQEHLQYREELSSTLLRAYEELLESPVEQPISITPEIKTWIATLDNGRRSATIGSWSQMTPYWKSIVASYGKEIFDKFGSLKMVDSAQVPLGVISVMKSSKVKWEG